MTQYRVGDKVVLVSDWWNSQPGFWEGDIKIVTGVKKEGNTTRLQLEGDSYFWYMTEEFAVELVEEDSFKGNRTEIELKFLKLKLASEES